MFYLHQLLFTFNPGRNELDRAMLKTMKQDLYRQILVKSALKDEKETSEGKLDSYQKAVLSKL